MQEGQRDFLGKRHVDLPDTPLEAPMGWVVTPPKNSHWTLEMDVFHKVPPSSKMGGSHVVSRLTPLKTNMTMDIYHF